MRRFFYAFCSKRQHLLSLLLATLICVLSLIPIPEKNLPKVPFYDKWTHLLMYGLLSAIIYWECWHRNRNKALSTVLLKGFVLPVLLGGILELAQNYLTNCRSGDWMDFGANMLGTLLASLIATLYYKNTIGN